MSESRTSYKEILRSTFIMGGASFLKILIGVVRIKVLAVVLGPTGVGLIGVLTSAMTMGASVAGMGLNSSGVRQIAASTDDEEKLPYVRRALWYANLFLGILGGLVFWVFRNQISELLFDSTENATLISLLGIGVFLSVLCGAQYALLQGMRRIGDLARATIISSVISAVIGVGAVVLWKEQGIIIFVIVGPLATIVIGSYYAAKLPRPGHMVFSLKRIYHEWRGMFLLGIVMMSSGVMQAISQLAVRIWVTRDFGLEATGYFQASWAISVTYIGLILSAMAADYYPKLAANIKDIKTSNSLVNDQTEMALMMAGPPLIIMLGWTPIVINLLYSAEFVESVPLLRWQLCGDLFKVASWPLGFVLIARGHSRLFFITELMWVSSYLGLIYYGLPIVGLEATGLMFFASYFLYLAVMLLLVGRLTGFLWTRLVLILFTVTSVSMFGIFAATLHSELLTAIVSGVIGVAFGLYSLQKILKITGMDAQVSAFFAELKARYRK